MEPASPPLPCRRPSWTGTIALTRLGSLARRGFWSLRDRLLPSPPPQPPALPRPGAPLRVGFLICSPAKWGLSSLLGTLRADAQFEVSLYPTLSDVDHRRSPAARRASFLEKGAFWAMLGTQTTNLYDPDSDRMHDLASIDCDVLFLQQPWGMQDLPRRLSRRMRVAYIHYGMPVISNDRMQFGLPHFHPYLWRYFVPTQIHAEAISATPGPRPPDISISGHTKFDTFLSPAPARDAAALWPPGHKHIIFAPHHGIDPGSLALGTFAWSGPAMLSLAQRHPQIAFALRPHPNMEIGLARSGVMQPSDWAAYKARWADLPNGTVIEGGDYWDMFRTSDAMITDAGSFLAEYMPTGSPLIRLERADAAPLNTFGERLAPGFYRCTDSAGLETHFDSVVLRNEDPLATTRAKVSSLLRPFARPAADIIAEELRTLLS